MLRLNRIRFFSTAVLIILGAYLCSAQKFEVLSGSKMEIHGSSNVNQFTCIYPTQEIKPLEIDFNTDQMLFRKAEIHLPVATFDCGGHGINRDFKDLLQEKEHPEVKINLKKLNLISSTEAMVSLNLEIAGIKNNYRLPVKYQKKNKYFTASATLPLNIDDFELEQPRRLFGLIVVHKEIDIIFDLRFKASSD